MNKTELPYVIYLAKFPGKQGWEQRCIVSELDEAELHIKRHHPNVHEFKIIDSGNAPKEYIGSDTRMIFSPLTLWEKHWYPEEALNLWFAPGEVPPRPDVIPILSNLEISPSEPFNFWWKWYLFFTPADQEPVSNLDFNLRDKSCNILFSDSPNQVKDLLAFCEEIKNGKDAILIIYEEQDLFKIMVVWQLPEERILLRLDSAGYKDDFTKYFKLNRDNFLDQIERAYQDLQSHAGWDEESDPDDGPSE